MSKTCKTCLQSKSVEEFYARSGGRCKQCILIHRATPEERANKRARRVKKQYGMTVTAYEATLESRRNSMSKICSKCHQHKPRDEFYLTQGMCKKCTSVQRAGYSNNPARKELYRARTLTRTYGITIAEYAAMLERQGGVCAICSKAETKVWHTGTLCRLAVDHNHTTGAPRSLLCHACNVGLGNFKDDHQLLELAASYLKSYAPQLVLAIASP